MAEKEWQSANALTYNYFVLLSPLIAKYREWHDTARSEWAANLLEKALEQAKMSDSRKKKVPGVFEHIYREMMLKLINSVKKLTDGELMLKIRKGQERAFEELYRRYARRLQGFFTGCRVAIKNRLPILPKRYLSGYGNFVINTTTTGR